MVSNIIKNALISELLWLFSSCEHAHAVAAGAQPHRHGDGGDQPALERRQALL